MSNPQPQIPYKIAALCYLYDDQGRLLLLKRAQEPNKGLYSPIGGKLHMHEGESPAACARREIREEVELDIDPAHLHLTGLVSETAFNNEAHWLMFLYEVTVPCAVQRMSFSEGDLEWHAWDEIPDLAIPETDRLVIYPLLRRFHDQFFHVHIDCRNGQWNWRLEHPADVPKLRKA
jgi:8-oxo-dGTP diphosphatase